MKYLSIDFGTKKVGLAVSDLEGRMAYPLCILKNSPKLAKDITALCEKEGVSEIVMGHSLDQKGNENALMQDIRDLMGQLSFTLGLPIHLMDERFSTGDVYRGRPSGARGDVSRTRTSSKKNAPVDDSAAALILQRYLDKQ